MNFSMNTPTLPPSQRAARPFPEAGLRERVGPPAVMNADQRAASDELINGPRKAVYGPFRALLHKPGLLRAVAKLGEAIRFEGALGAQLREWLICVVSREQSNVFEWDMHVPLAIAAGVSPGAIHAVDAGLPLPEDTSHELQLAREVAVACVRQHRLSDATYEQAVALWGEATLVEVMTVIGYFAMVNTLMNVARAPSHKAP
jgi:4-carboxymuconolactone decarboxylase